MSIDKKRDFSFKIWIEHEGRPIIGKGGAEILAQIEKERSISKTARKLGMSYRYVWNYLAKIEDATGEPVVETYRGGSSGGGGAKLTRLGENLLLEYNRLENRLDEAISHVDRLEVKRVKISARNRLKGKVVAVEKDKITAKVKIQITVPATVTSLISTEALKGLAIRVGDEVEAVVKATEVMMAK